MFDRVPVRVCTRWRAAAVVAATAVVGAAWAQDGYVSPALKNDGLQRTPANATEMSTTATLPKFAFGAGQVNAGALNGGGAIPTGGPCTQPAANCQLPDQGGHGEGGIIGIISDTEFPNEVADNFTVDAGGSISTVCWWGFYGDLAFDECADPEPPSADDFTIRFYNNDPACPNGNVTGTPFAVRAVGQPLRAQTGNTVGGNLEYEYSATISPAVAVSAGQCVWISIQNNTPVDDCRWLWSTAPGGDNDSSTNSGGGWEENDWDQAYCINLTMDPPDCGLAPLPACVAPCPWDCADDGPDGSVATADLLTLLGDWGGPGPCDFDGGGTTTADLLKLLGEWGDCPSLPGDCGAPHAGTGCNDECCCTTVCLLDSFCCDTEWDLNCANNAILSGCATFPLCEGQDDSTCQLYADVNALTSTLGGFHSADDFTPVSSGTVQEICWHGVYDLNNAVVDSFRLRILNDLDADGFPENELYSELLGDVPQDDTGVDLVGRDVYQYEATLSPGLAVTAGDCYWLEIVNDAGDTWFWAMSESGPDQSDPLKVPRQGNARCLQDAEATSYGLEDMVADIDLAFCVGLEITDAACGFVAMHHTGPHETVGFDAANGGNLAPTHLGWSSGDLDGGAGTDSQRRCVQAFTMPALPAGGVWSIEQVLVEGFDPGGVTNEELNFRFYSRTALDVAPTDADWLDTDGDAIPDTITVGFGDPTGTVTERTGFVATPGFATLPPGDYWMTMFASNAAGTASNFAWFTNAMCNEANGDNCINNACTNAMQPPYGGSVGCAPAPGGDPPGTPAMWRAHLYPVPGFGAYTLPTTMLDVDEANDSEPNPADLYNAAFYIRGTPMP
jgi:hypothetical protein